MCLLFELSYSTPTSHLHTIPYTLVNQTANAPLSYRSISIGQDLALTYSTLVKARPVLEIVITNLGLDLTPGALRDMLRTDLVPDTQLLQLILQDTDPQRASDIANEVAATFIHLHSLEQQYGSIAALEQDLLSQMENLKELIDESWSTLDELDSRAKSVTGEAIEGDEPTLDHGTVPTSPLAAGLDGGSAPNRDDPAVVQDPTAEGSSLRGALSSQVSAFSNLLATYLNVQLTKSQFFDVSIVEPAIPPKTPVRPNIPLYTLLGAFLVQDQGTFSGMDRCGS